MFESDKTNIENLILVAQKKEPADLVLKNAKIVNVFTEEVYPADIAIKDGTIAALGSNYKGEAVIDLTGKFVCPGFIDGHLHVESSMVPIPEFAKVVVPHGTTTIIIDPHEIANVMGTTGITYMLKTSKYNPLNVFMMLPSCVPATPLETAGAELKALDLFPLMQDKWVLGLGEMMNYPGVLACQDEVLDKIKISQGRIIDGHAPGITGDELNAYVAAGMRSDHECTLPEEALEKLRLGLYIMIREGSTTKNLLDLLPLVNEQNINQCFFVTDDRSPAELMDEGHIDNMVRKATAFGMRPSAAIRMATINPARYFGLKYLGAIAPGYDADMLVLKDLEKITIERVFKNGICVAENGIPIYQSIDHQKIMMRGSINVKWIERQHFQVKALSNQFRVIQMIPEQIVTKESIFDTPICENGYMVSDTKRDLLKLAVIERHYGSGRTGLGFIKGFGLKKGAIASTIAHDSHNIIAVGVTDEDIYQAVVQLVRQQGGLAVAADGEVLGSLP
ncbi:adenine deaminase, partial [bacterium]|nr:adenine deaminase [candidate division CSSED10-310 bacterium]